jgi:hypothetical protein
MSELELASRRWSPAENEAREVASNEGLAWRPGPSSSIDRSFIHVQEVWWCQLAVSCIISLLLSDCCLRPAGRPKDEEAAGSGVWPGPHRSSQSCAMHQSPAGTVHSCDPAASSWAGTARLSLYGGSRSRPSPRVCDLAAIVTEFPV